MSELSPSKNKIAIVSQSLGRGGAERFAGILSKLLDSLGYEIHNILIEDLIAYEYTGKLYNLGEICEADSVIQRKIKKGILLKKYLDHNQINTVIDNRSKPNFLREIFTKWVYGKRQKIFMVHSFNLQNYLPNSALAAKWLYHDAKKLVCVSKAIEQEINQKYHLKNTVTIYNPLPELAIPDKRINVSGNYILFFGRLVDNVKNFSLMLEGFGQSKVQSKGYQLVILGNGPDEDFIKTEIKRLKLHDSVQLLPFQHNPYAYVSRAQFTLLTSHYEGFPMSVIESLALGVPVISVDCQSGPAEIIQNEKNGLLIPNHNSAALATAIVRLVEDANLYDICKSNAAASVAHLSVENTARQWQQILQQ